MDMEIKKVGIIGSGVVARALGNGFIKHGYQVMTGSRDPSKLDDWKNTAGKQAFSGNFSEAASFGDLLVLAVSGGSALNALSLAGDENINNKIIIDVTNPIAEAPPQNGVLQFFTDYNQSLMEKLQQGYPGAHFVKAFNSVGSALMVNPDFVGGKPTMFICGNDETARKTVTKIVELFGWEVSDMGKAEAARAIEPLCMLYCIPGILKDEWSHAFKLFKK